MVDDGGPAFPAVIPLEHNAEHGKDYPNYTDCGMSLRDYFAAKAMPVAQIRYGVADPLTEDALARRAYSIADAMLKAREEQP